MKYPMLYLLFVGRSSYSTNETAWQSDSHVFNLVQSRMSYSNALADLEKQYGTVLTKYSSTS
jgi:hypothetical protein